VATGAGFAGSVSRHVVPWLAYGQQFSSNVFSFTEARKDGKMGQPRKAAKAKK
jgi:hypothetical protein